MARRATGIHFETGPLGRNDFRKGGLRGMWDACVGLLLVVVVLAVLLLGPYLALWGLLELFGLNSSGPAPRAESPEYERHTAEDFVKEWNKLEPQEDDMTLREAADWMRESNE